MPKVDDKRLTIVTRLKLEGWESIGGKVHENFTKPGMRMIQVPRHRTLSQGVARSIAKAAGWY